MTTSIHQRPQLRLELDCRAACALKVNRNRLTFNAINRELAQELDWSTRFLERLGTIDKDAAETLDQIVSDVRYLRSSKPPRAL